MVLITGGAFQGKLEYALQISGLSNQDVVDCEICDFESIDSAKILNKFHVLIKRMLDNNMDVKMTIEQIIKKNPHVIIVVNEVGCGIVPIDPFERMHRETTGRMSCILAKEAQEVHRVICGLGQVIKNA